MKRKFDAIVLGPGMAGLGTALALARLNRRVLVIGRKKINGDSSPAAAGILDPLLEMSPDSPFLPFCMRAFRGWTREAAAIEKVSRKKIGYNACGMFYAAFTPEEEKKLRGRFAWQKKFLSAVLKDRSWALKREPDLNPAVRSGIYYPSIGRVQPRRLLSAMKAEARKRGVRFVLAGSTPHLDAANGKIRGVSIGKTFYETEAVVNAAGSWAGEGIVPVRGQILVVERKKLKVGMILHTLDGGYIVPWDKNNLVLGSTVEHAGFKPLVTPEGRKAIRKKNQRLVPALAECRELDRWAGLRPFPKDRFPLIGPSHIPGLFIAAGYYRSGILIGNYAGRLLAQGMVSGKMPAELKPFDPRRF